MADFCVGCGECCDHLGYDLDERAEWLEAAAAAPDVAAAFEEWAEQGWTFEQAVRAQTDARFILAHWHRLPEGEATCDRYDPVTRRCTVYEDRPPICRDYPWYSSGRTPDSEERLPAGCSYRADWQPVKMLERVP